MSPRATWDQPRGHRVVRLRGRRKTPASDQDRAALSHELADLAPHQRIWFGKFLVGAVLLSLSSPVEIAVPLVRALLRKPGVQTGAAIGSVLSFLAGWAYFTAIARWPHSETLIDRSMDRLIFSGAVILPAAGAVLPVTVVLPRRSPLWGWALWLMARLLASTVMAEEALPCENPKRNVVHQDPASKHLVAGSSPAGRAAQDRVA
jgi:Ca2+/Na+ antiporter